MTPVSVFPSYSTKAVLAPLGLPRPPPLASAVAFEAAAKALSERLENARARARAAAAAAVLAPSQTMAAVRPNAPAISAAKGTTDGRKRPRVAVVDSDSKAGLPSKKIKG